MPQLKSKKGVEIFSAGVWNGDEYTVEDLDEMIRAFSETSAKVLPYLKLGHDKDQKLLQADGYPAAGWVGDLYRSGEKLMADFADIPDKIYALLENKAYKKVSSEVYWNIKINGQMYKRMLGAVALLGANMPAVTNLDDILALYGITDYYKLNKYSENEKEFSVKTYDFTQKDQDMPKKLEELEQELADAKAYSQKIETEKKESEDKLIAENKEYKQKIEVALQNQKKAELEKALTELEKEELLTKAMKPFVCELLNDEVKEVYTVVVKTSEDKEQTHNFNTKADLLKEALKLFKASSVNLENNSDKGKEKEKFDEVAEVEKLMSEKNYSLLDATNEVLKIKKQKEKGE